MSPCNLPVVMKHGVRCGLRHLGAGDRQPGLHRAFNRFLALGLSALLVFAPAARAVFAAEAPQGTELAQKLLEEGINSYREGRYEEAIRKLEQALPLAPGSSPALLYLGLAHLRLGRTREAVAAWQQYTQVEPLTEEEKEGDLQQKVQEYLKLLLLEQNKQQARSAIAREAQIGPGDPQTVAITYYRNLGSKEFDPLQKGLTALLISCVSKVQEINVVERDLLQALLEEMKLGKTAVVDATTAPRVGRLLGAGKVATGGFLDVEKERLRVDSVVAESTTTQVVGTQQAAGTVQKFDDVYRRLCLEMLADLGYNEESLKAAGVYAAIITPATTSTAAVTAFAAGLEAKDRGDYAAARKHFEKALQEDPNFKEARDELDALPLLFLSTGAIIAAVEGSAPSAAGGAGIGAGAIAVGAVIAAGAIGGIVGGVNSGTGGGGARCGNGKKEGKEECDGNDFGQTIPSCPAGATGGGPVTCDNDCNLDESACFVCGNGIIEGEEECDTTDLGGAVCAEGGTISCDNDCRLDKSQCVSDCGNGMKEGMEECDMTDLGGALCAEGGTLRCSNVRDPGNCTLDRSRCKGCGNDVKEGREECDGNDFGQPPAVCPDGGVISCASDCTLDESECFACGNDRREGNEICDGMDQSNCSSTQVCVNEGQPGMCTCCGWLPAVIDCDMNPTGVEALINVVVTVDAVSQCPASVSPATASPLQVTGIGFTASGTGPKCSTPPVTPTEGNTLIFTLDCSVVSSVVSVEIATNQGSQTVQTDCP